MEVSIGKSSNYIISMVDFPAVLMELISAP
jgi:hypothetical protein